MKKIGIIGAMEQEVAELKSKMGAGAFSDDKLRLQITVGNLSGKEVALVKCGIGKVNAAVCTQILIDQYDVGCVINTGVAGAISKELNIGDVVVSKDLVQHDFDTSATGDVLGVIPGLNADSFLADTKLINAAKKAGEAVLSDKHKLFVGRIATGDQFISTREQKQKIDSNFNAMCAEMEGGAIAQACFINKIPFVVIRAISDKADEAATMSFEQFIEFAAKNSAGIVERMLEDI